MARFNELFERVRTYYGQDRTKSTPALMLWGENEFDDAVIIRNPTIAAVIYLAAFERHRRNSTPFDPRAMDAPSQLMLPLEDIINSK